MKAIRTVLALTAASVGVGMTGRGILGLRNAMKTTGPKALDSGSWVPRKVHVPIVRQDTQDAREKRYAPAPRAMQMAQFPKAADAPLTTLTTRLKQATGDKERPLDKAVGWLAKQLPDSFGVAPTPAASWWAVPALAAGGAGGLYGGWKLVDHFMNKAHDEELDDSLSQSKKDYQTAISEQFARPESKYASLDTVYEKRAEIIKDAYTWGNFKEDFRRNVPLGNKIVKPLATTAHGAGGAYLTALLAVGGGSAAAVHSYMKSRSKKRILDKALAKRRKQRALYNQPIQLVTDEVNADDYGNY